MKRIVAFLIAMVMILSAAAALASSAYRVDVSDLSRRNARYMPYVYVKPQVKIDGNTRDTTLYTSDLGYSSWYTSYGLYWKYTNTRYKNGIPNGRRDIVIYDPRGSAIYRETFYVNWQDCDLKYNWYRYENFLNLDDMFERQLQSEGYIMSGSYEFALFIDKEFAGSAKFKVNYR